MLICPTRFLVSTPFGLKTRIARWLNWREEKKKKRSYFWHPGVTGLSTRLCNTEALRRHANSVTRPSRRDGFPCTVLPLHLHISVDIMVIRDFIHALMTAWARFKKF